VPYDLTMKNFMDQISIRILAKTERNQTIFETAH